MQCLRDFGTVEMMVVVITWLSDCDHMSVTATPILPFPDWIVGFFLSFSFFHSFLHVRLCAGNDLQLRQA